ncbi:hypothetical protein KY360_07510 [Candidatus Woesearchaeota archaeon]|nr:hypothetical protein [Candidatus Woesearchaeota archaeon]
MDLEAKLLRTNMREVSDLGLSLHSQVRKGKLNPEEALDHYYFKEEARPVLYEFTVEYFRLYQEQMKAEEKFMKRVEPQLDILKKNRFTNFVVGGVLLGGLICAAVDYFFEPGFSHYLISVVSGAAVGLMGYTFTNVRKMFGTAAEMAGVPYVETREPEINKLVNDTAKKLAEAGLEVKYKKQ